ncbi:VWA domain-containing protein, partial [Candidatus Poribacteria bacterium]|nr:VWA domain-containing protein [Candidatus Poribacteria bacterium]
MKHTEQYIWKWRMALLVLAAWIGIDGFSALTAAPVRPPQPQRGIIIRPKDDEKKDAQKVDIGESLVDIARRASRQSKNPMIDLAFVIDGGAQMETPIAAVEKRLVDMVSAFEEAGLRYQFALIGFQNVNNTPQTIVNPLQSDFGALQESFRDLRIKLGGAGTGYGLDAIMQGLRELEFRFDATKHIVVVTNDRLQTSWDVEDAKSQLVREIIDRCNRDGIHINVIGIGEGAQVQLADETDGKWYAIDENQKRMEPSLLIDKSILKIEGIFKHIAQHIAATVRSAADIVFVIDSSLSMENKVDEICAGVDRMVHILDDEGMDYRFGVIRFWAAAGGGESTVLVTKPPLDANQVKAMFRIPKQGDEHLLDAIMEGVPKLKTPDERQLVLVIVTDESTSRRLEEV